MSEALTKAMDGARQIFDDNLGELPRLLAKTAKLRAALGADPSVIAINVVSAWCAEHPLESARIVGAVAMVAVANGGAS